MRRTEPRASRARWARALAGLAVAAVTALAGAPQPAQGHALLLDADPAPNSVIPGAPESMVLVFSEAVDGASVRVRLVDADGRPVPDVGDPVLDAAARVVTVDLPELAVGTYAVDYAVVSAIDGHPTASLYAFVVDPTGTATPPAAAPDTTETPPDPLAVATRWVGTLAVLLLLGSLLVDTVHRRLASPAVALSSSLVPAGLATITLVALVVHLWASAIAVFGAPGPPWDPAAPYGWTPFAVAMRLALVGCLIAIGGALMLRAGTIPRVAMTACAAGAILAVLGLALTGHAAALGGPVGTATDAFHLLAIAAWLGGLPAIGLLALRTRRAGGDGVGLGRAALRVHARVALIAAPVVILTGVANSSLVVGDPRELAAAGYGNWVLAKAWLVSMALGLGAATFFLSRLGGRRWLAGLVAAEVAVAVVAVAVGATMVSIVPATDRPPSVTDPRLGVAHLYGQDGGSAVHGIVDLPEPGVQDYLFAITDPESGFAREDLTQLALTFVPPAGSGLEPGIALAHPGSQPWLWEVQGAYTPVAGEWQLEVVVTRGRLESDRIVFTLAVRQVVEPLPLPPPTTGGQLLGALSAPAGLLPPGAAGWLAPIGLLAVVVTALAVERRRRPPGAGRVVRALRVVAVVAAVGIGVSLLARDVVAVANRPPAAWEAAINPLAADPGAAVAGQALYQANCAGCHGLSGAGDGPLVADLLRPPGDLAGIVPHRSDGALAWTIAAGQAGTQMPAFGTTLLESERWEVVSYLRDRWPTGTE